MKYLEIKNYIINDIKSGKLNFGDILPSRYIIQKRYNVSTTTISKALDELRLEGYIITKQGKGAFVTDKFASKKDIINQKKTIAVFMPYMTMSGDRINDIRTSNIAPIIINSLSILAQKNNCDILIYISNNSSNTEKSNIRTAINKKIDGMIIYPFQSWKTERIIEEINESKIPYVLIDSDLTGSLGGFVSTDHYAGSYNTCKYIFQNFTENIYHITVDDGAYSLSLRKFAYKDFMLEQGIFPKVIYTNYPDIGEDFNQNIYDCISNNIEIFKKGKCGITTSNAHMMSYIYSALVDHKIDLANIALSAFDKMPTIIDKKVLFLNVIQDLEKIAEIALFMLINKINETDELKTVVIPSVTYINNKEFQFNKKLGFI